MRYHVLAITAQSEKMIDEADDLHTAAASVHSNTRRSYAVAVLDTETGERWSYNELDRGGFMADCKLRPYGHPDYDASNPTA